MFAPSLLRLNKIQGGTALFDFVESRNRGHKIFLNLGKSFQELLNFPSFKPLNSGSDDSAGKRDQLSLKISSLGGEVDVLFAPITFAPHTPYQTGLLHAYNSRERCRLHRTDTPRQLTLRKTIFIP
jgi:hypothetical protein